MRNSKIWLVLLLAALTTIAGCRLDEIAISLSREEIQAHITPRFPITNNWLVVSVILREPEIFLPEDTNQIGIKMIVEVNIPLLKPISGHLTATAVPRYDAESKSFYLDKCTMERLYLPGLVPELDTRARIAIETIARQELAKHPIYKLKGKHLQVISAAYTLREVQVRDGKLRAAFTLSK